MFRFQIGIMQRLGKSSSRPSEWETSSAFYSRLTLNTSTGISRPQLHYPQLLPSTSESAYLPDGIRIFKTELIDIGHIRTYHELCKSDLALGSGLIRKF